MELLGGPFFYSNAAMEDEWESFKTVNGLIKGDGAGAFSAITLDTDTALASNSDTRVASQKATKAYIDALIEANNVLQGKGAIDCSASPNYPAANFGHAYRVSVAGKIGGGSGPTVEVNDLLICWLDSSPAGTHAAVGANWSIQQVNIASTSDITEGTNLYHTTARVKAIIAAIPSAELIGFQWSVGDPTVYHYFSKATAYPTVVYTANTWSATAASLEIQQTNTSINTIVPIQTFKRMSSGVATAGIGGALDIWVQNTAGTAVQAGMLSAHLTNVGVGTEASTITLWSLVAGAWKDLLTLVGGQMTLGRNGAAGEAGSLVLCDGLNPGSTATLTQAKWADLEAVNGFVLSNGSGNYSAATPGAHVADASSTLDSAISTVNTVISRLETLGLLASS